jgi:hypothetical protein
MQYIMYIIVWSAGIAGLADILAHAQAGIVGCMDFHVIDTK